MSEAVRLAFGAGGALAAAAGAAAAGAVGGGAVGQRAASPGLQRAAWTAQPPGVGLRPLFPPDQTPEAIAEAARQLALAESQRQADAKAAARRLEEAQAHAGFLAGRDSGEKAAAAQYQARLAEIAASLASLASLRADVLSRSEAEVVRLALHIASQVLLCDVDHRRSFTERMVHESLLLLREADAVSLRLAPADIAALKASRPELMAMPNVTLVEDASINLGGVIADCALGRVDATLDARLAAMRLRLCPPDAALTPAAPA